MNVSLIPQLEAYLRGKVESGLYNNVSEVVREALRLFFEPDSRSSAKAVSAQALKVDILASLAALEKPLRVRGIISLSLFGSIVRGEGSPSSDADVLVDVSRKSRFSLVDLASLKDFLEAKLERKVDVVTREGLDPYIRDGILRDAQKVF